MMIVNTTVNIVDIIAKPVELSYKHLSLGAFFIVLKYYTDHLGLLQKFYYI